MSSEKEDTAVSEDDAYIRSLEASCGMEYDPLQREAITGAAHHQVMVLTGGPGTGKTTVLRAVIERFENDRLSVALCAPTGRAAKRLSEVTGREAGTLHRLLGMQYGENEGMNFRKNEDDPLNQDVVVCDEASMIDVFLLDALLNALKPSARLILVGDSDQLPSVGAGDILHDLIGSGKIFTVRLTTVFRQAAESLIVTNAHKIIGGEQPTLDIKDKDFFFIETRNGSDCAETIRGLCETRLPAAYNYDPLEDIQIISPTKKYASGTVSLNQTLRDALNPSALNKREAKRGDRIFREGDKIMQIRNNYDVDWVKDSGEKGTGVYNGDIGVVETVDHQAEILTVRYDDRRANYEFGLLDELDLAYAITVHKSQGSEFRCVILAAVDGDPRLLHRNLLYTAITRAMDKLIIVGRKTTLNAMIDNVRNNARYTALKAFLANRM